MHKYDIVNSDWSINIRIVKFELYINRLINTDHKSTGSVIRELCEHERVVTHVIFLAQRTALFVGNVMY